MRITFDNDIFGAASYFDSISPESYEGLSLDVQFVSQDDSLRPADAPRSPFATNPNNKSKGCIVYNKEIIDKVGFTPEELFGQIAHEIGHINKGFLDSQDQSEIIANEIYCDSFACECGLGLALASSLVKMSESYEVYGLNERLEAIGSRVNLFRPEWTCGRYNSAQHAAILYNLIEGADYFFEGISADVIGTVLEMKRNDQVSLKTLTSLNKKVSLNDTVPFFYELLSLGLISTHRYSDSEIERYRDSISMNRIIGNSNNSLKGDSMSPLSENLSSAEMEYTDTVGGITSIMMELTYNCSEKCIHCYNPGAARNSEEKSSRHSFHSLSIEEYEKIVDELYDKGLVKVCLSGGDPFSYKDCWKLIEYLYEKGIATEIYTNGQNLFGREKEFAKYYPCMVGISIYSDSPEVHDSITRVKGSFEKSVRVIESLSKLAVPTAIKCCILKPNLSSYYGVREIAKQYGCAMQYEINVVDSIDGDKCVSTFLRLSKEEYEVVLSDPAIAGYITERTEILNQPERLEQPPCRAGHNSFCLSPSGDLMPCCSFHLVFGNLAKDTLVDILRSEVLDEWKNTKVSQYEECLKHDYCAVCTLCSGNNYSEHGDYKKAAENNCFIAKIRYDLIQKEKKGFDPLCGMPLNQKLKSIVTQEVSPRRILLKKE